MSRLFRDWAGITRGPDLMNPITPISGAIWMLPPESWEAIPISGADDSDYAYVRYRTTLRFW